MKWYRSGGKKTEEGDPGREKMLDWFKKRTARHIGLVQKYCKKISEYDEDKFRGLTERGRDHDQSKYEAPEMDPYVYITWQYKCKADEVDWEPPKGMADKMNEASDHHVNSNRHHPEFHCDRKVKVNREDRDKPPDEMVDATSMTDLDLAEMAADWMAMSEELDDEPIDWADKNVNKRWKFTKAQEDLIYELIDAVWE